jgi:hypothetical protein
MNLSALKQALNTVSELRFRLPNGNFVASHFHVTEIAVIKKDFIDCGGTLRSEQKLGFQLWQAEDYDHRLAPTKLLNIIEIAELTFDVPNAEIEIEYQGATIEKYGLVFNQGYFQLLSLKTDCLAQDKCGIPQAKPKIKLADLQSNVSACCSPESGCC